MENCCGRTTAANVLRQNHCGKSLRPVYALRNKRPLRLLRILIDRVALDRVAFDRVAFDRVAFDRVAFDFHPYNNGSSGSSDATHTVARCNTLAPGSRSWRTVWPSRSSSQ